MRYWFDTEFIEDGHTIELISIGIVAEDGREYYAEVAGVDYGRADAWVQANVIAHLWVQHPGTRDPNIWVPGGITGGWLTKREVARSIAAFCNPNMYGTPEFWAYYADYDWVALCQLYGTMMQLPTGWPKYCMDIKQWATMLGNPILPTQGKDQHHALADARWNKAAWEYLHSMCLLPHLDT